MPMFVHSSLQIVSKFYSVPLPTGVTSSGTVQVRYMVKVSSILIELDDSKTRGDAIVI